jgi:hypothetical protein
MRRFFTRQIVPQLLIFTISVGVLQAAETAKLDTAKLDTDKRDAAITKSIAYLQSKGQAENGSFTAAAGPAITGLCVGARTGGSAC